MSTMTGPTASGGERHRRCVRVALRAAALAAAMAVAAGCETNATVRATNASREIVSMRLVRGPRDNGAQPIAGAVMGPMGRFEYSGQVPSRAQLRIRRWEDGAEVGETLVVEVPRGTEVQTMVDVSGGRLLLRDTSTRTRSAW